MNLHLSPTHLAHRTAAAVVWPAVLWCLLAAVGTVGAAEFAPAIGPSQICPDTTCGLRPGDQMWIVNTRHLGWPACEPIDQPRIKQYVEGAGWFESSIEQLLAAPPLLTVIWVHGNRFESPDAIEAGWNLYRVLRADHANEPFRLIIWSWPSDKISGPVRDARAKAARADVEGYYLAEFLLQLDPTTPCGLVGYSFGARVIAGALQGIVRGEYRGLPLPQQPDSPLPMYQVVLLGAAVDARAFAREFVPALQAIQEMLVTFNLRDPVLRRYRLLERYGDRRAMGFSGFAGSSTFIDAAGTPQRVGVYNVNATASVGRSHDYRRYFNSPYLSRLIRRQLFWEEATRE